MINISGAVNINTIGTTTTTIGNILSTTNISGSSINISGALNINTGGTATTTIGNINTTTNLSGTTYISKIDTLTPTTAVSLYPSLTDDIVIAKNTRGSIIIADAATAGTDNLIIVGTSTVSKIYLRGTTLVVNDQGSGTTKLSGAIELYSPITPKYGYPITGNYIGAIKTGTCSLADGTNIINAEVIYGSITADYTGVYLITGHLFYFNNGANILVQTIIISINGTSITNNSITNNSQWNGFPATITTATQLYAGDIVQLRLFVFGGQPPTSSTDQYMLKLVRIA